MEENRNPQPHVQEQERPAAGLPSAPRNRDRPGHGRAREGRVKGAHEAGAPLETVVGGHPGGRRGSLGGGGALPQTRVCRGKGGHVLAGG